MDKFYCKFFFTLTFLFFIQASVNAQSVRLPTQLNEREKLPEQLITEALKRGGLHRATFPYGDIEHLPLSTRINGVRNGSLDVFFAMTTPEYEEEFQAVYIPLYRGLMGMRLAIISQNKKEQFSQVKTLNDLAQFSAGQGKLWADSKILEHNGLPLVLELKYPNLFRMLEAERFDYFPRGIHEPWAEVNNWSELGLMVDPYIMLQYKAPVYFFVHKDNQALANHLTENLQSMIDDGKFLDLFYEDTEVKMALAQANIHKRTIIPLDNPFLTNNTPLNQSELWFKPSEIQAQLSVNGKSL